MSVLEIVDGGINELTYLYHQHFTKDFAIDELKNYEQLELLITRKNYKLLLAKDRTSNEIAGYAFIYELEHLNAIWLDYMAIIKKFRNRGYGTLLFEKIVHFKENGLGVFIEVEIPDEGDNKENQLRRINFYERLGAERLNIDYKLPTHNGGFPMYLYFKPTSNTLQLPKKLIQKAITEIFENIHTDVINREHILRDFISTVQDEHFS
ncbi:GNAT family N-acetyltransferase [Neobacillus cucumis]|uniref:GNAT family N-acetyltransferase n=1 Tax=Neobacillus cucumis TaxID=1740721 RepID=UPI0028532909|nr:GNAT family N-acetyltransferase [Neobacillus cucumis]MDR4947797.1 GNAT family N-acetyltransferase [Neobacillus cucumis]